MHKLSKIGYALPLFVRSILNTFIDANLTKFYLQDLCKHSATCLTSTRFGLVSSLIGTLGLFIDILISHLVDRSHARFRSHIPMIVMCAPIWCVSVAALFYPIYFTSIPIDTSTQLSIWFTFFSVLKNVVPLDSAFNALGSKLTNKISTQERDSLFAFKQYAGLIGGIAGGFIPFLLNPEYYSAYIFTGSFVLGLSYMFTVTVLKNDETKSYDQTKKTQAIPIIPGLKRSFYNRAFQVMLLLSLFEALRGLLWSGLYPFFFTKVLALDDPQYQLWGGIYNVLGMVLASLFTPLWQWASRRYGYYRTWLFSYLVQIPIGTVLYFTIDVGQQQVYRYLVFFILLCISGRASGFLYDSIKASMYDYDELYTGERREASIDASLSILPKYISLVSNSVSFGILSRFESDPITAGKCIAVQTTLLPSLTATICFLIMLQFPVTDKKHEQVKKGIELHQQGKSAHDPIHNQSVPVPVLKQQDILMDYFFDFELSNKKRIKYISIGSFILCTVTFLSCTVFFVQKTIYEKGNDTVATFALWLASVTFTLGLFFRERIQVINQITTFDKKSLSQSEHYEVVPEPKKLK